MASLKESLVIRRECRDRDTSLGKPKQQPIFFFGLYMQSPHPTSSGTSPRIMPTSTPFRPYPTPLSSRSKAYRIPTQNAPLPTCDERFQTHTRESLAGGRQNRLQGIWCHQNNFNLVFTPLTNTEMPQVSPMLRSQ